MIRTANGVHQAHSGQVRRQDQLTQDLLHKLELENLNAVEISAVAKQLKECRKIRRSHKDKVEELQPIVDFMSSAKNQSSIESLERLMHEIKKTEAAHKNRTYKNRVLEGEIK